MTTSPPPAPAPTSPPARPDRPAAAARPPEQQADILWHSVLPSRLTTAVGVESEVGPRGCGVFLERLVDNAGGPTDWIEVMLIQQTAVAHYSAAALQAKAAEAQSLEAVQSYSTAAARMLGEFRQIVVTLQKYREKPLVRTPAAPQAEEPSATTQVRRQQSSAADWLDEFFPR